MIVSLRRWVARVVFLFLFFVLLLIATGGYRLLVEVISPVHPYQKPKGSAIKVFRTDPDSPDEGNMADHLRWFYWYGE